MKKIETIAIAGLVLLAAGATWARPPAFEEIATQQVKGKQVDQLVVSEKPGALTLGSAQAIREHLRRTQHWAHSTGARPRRRIRAGPG